MPEMRNTCFAHIVNYATQFQQELAIEFEVSPSTVARWAMGNSYPSPRMRKLIITSIAKRLGFNDN